MMCNGFDLFSKVREATARRCTAQRSKGEAMKSEGMARQSTAKQRLRTDSQRYEKARKRYVGNGRALTRKAMEMLSTEKRWRRQAYSGEETNSEGDAEHGIK